MTNKINDNWYENFFQGLNAELWERAATPEWTKEEVDFIVNELNVKHGQRIIDIPCGFGRHSVELARRGYQVTGVDISKTFLQSLNDKIKAEGLNIRTIQADVLAVEMDTTFSGAVCMGNSFGYFNYEKMKLFVQKVSLVLEPGARFIINSSMLAESVLVNYSKNSSYTFEDLRMDISQTYDIEEGCVNVHILYTKGDKKEEHAFKHYVFTLSEVKRLLQQFGLSTIQAYSSTQKTPYNIGDHQVYLVAEKQ